MGEIMTGKLLALLLAISAIALTGTAGAGPIAEKATEAERLLDGGDAAAALDRLNEAMEIAWDAAPLIVRKALYLEQKASGFGIYVERSAPATFRPGEKLFVYVEPVGYGYGRDAVGSRLVGFNVDFTLTDPDGKVLFSKDDFLQVGSPVRYKNREFFLNLTVNLTGLGPGNYVSKFRLRDQNSEKSAAFELPFSLAE